MQYYFQCLRPIFETPLSSAAIPRVRTTREHARIQSYLHFHFQFLRPSRRLYEYASSETIPRYNARTRDAFTAIIRSPRPHRRQRVSLGNILISLLSSPQGAGERRGMGGKGAPVLPGEADRAEQRGRDHQRGKRVTSVTRYPRRADLEPVQFLQRLTSRWQLAGEPVPNYHL